MPKKIDYFDELGNGRYRTRIPLTKKLSVFFKSDSGGFKSCLIVNYNDLSKEQALQEHYRNLGGLLAQRQDAQDLFSHIRSDGYEKVTPRLIARYRAHPDCMPFNEANLSDDQLRAMVNDWFSIALSSNTEADSLLCMRHGYASDKVNLRVDQAEEDLAILDGSEGEDEQNLPTFYRATDKLLTENGFFVTSADYKSRRYLLVLANVRDATLELLEQRIEQLTGLEGQYPRRAALYKQYAVPSQVAYTQPNHVSAVTIHKSWGGLVDEFRTYKKEVDQVSDSAIRKYATPIRVTLEYFGVDKAISDITEMDCVGLKSLLEKIPKDVMSRKSSAELTVQQLIELGKDAGKPQRKPKTIKDEMDTVSAIFRYAISKHYLHENPVANIKVNVPKPLEKTANVRYSIDQLNQILRTEPFTDFLKLKLAKPAKLSPSEVGRRDFQWLTLLAIYTGARQKELVQLLATDFLQKDGVYALKIQPTTEEQSVKNNNSVRHVPIHPDLKNLGFVKYVTLMQTEGSKHMFAGVNSGQERPAGAFSKKFNNFLFDYMGKTKSDNRKMTFHSFRSTVAYFARSQSPGMDAARTIKMMGWGDVEVATGFVMLDSYAGMEELKDLYENVCKLQFPGLKIDHLIG